MKTSWIAQFLQKNSNPHYRRLRKVTTGITGSCASATFLNMELTLGHLRSDCFGRACQTRGASYSESSDPEGPVIARVANPTGGL